VPPAERTTDRTGFAGRQSNRNVASTAGVVTTATVIQLAHLLAESFHERSVITSLLPRRLSIIAVLQVGLCDALASLWATCAGAFAPVQAAAAIGHAGLLTGQAAAVLGTTARCFPEITRWVSVLQPAVSAHFSCSWWGDATAPTTA